ncbi:hypothetical protein ACTFIY_010760 [Dictyostelium cf. discoideum]
MFQSSHSNEQPSTNGNTNIIFTLYNIKSENYNKIPSIIIIPEQIIINGVSVNPPTNQDVHSYSFLIPAGCGKKDIQIIIGSQSCLSSITYFEPIIKNCLVSGFDGKNGNIVCDGSFGNKDYLFKSSVLFSNDEIVPPSINSTTFSFPLISGYHSDDLIFQMCGVQSKPFKLNISPTLKGIDQSQMDTLGGKFYILGEFFSSNINCSVFCNDKEYEGIFENSKTISFDLQIPGPNDIIYSSQQIPQNNQSNKINNGEGSSHQFQPQNNQSNKINNDEGSSHQFQPQSNQSNTINNGESSSQQIQSQNNQSNIINNGEGSSQQTQPQSNQSNIINNGESQSQQIQPQNNQSNIINNDVDSSQYFQQNDSTFDK